MGLACQTCDWLSRRDRGEAPLWDSILRTGFWDVVHCQGTSLPGWIVLVATRHINAIRRAFLQSNALNGHRTNPRPPTGSSTRNVCVNMRFPRVVNTCFRQFFLNGDPNEKALKLC